MQHGALGQSISASLFVDAGMHGATVDNLIGPRPQTWHSGTDNEPYSKAFSWVLEGRIDAGISTIYSTADLAELTALTYRKSSENGA